MLLQILTVSSNTVVLSKIAYLLTIAAHTPEICKESARRRVSLFNKAEL